MCGIAGFIGKEKMQFDKRAFLFLGTANDARGGDSTGIFIDGKYEVGVDSKKLFGNFFQDSPLIKKTNKAKIAIVHDRKASVGKINEMTAQPVVIENDKGEIDFVFMHNGTVHKTDELAKGKIKNIPDYFTDSYIFAYILYYNGFDILKEYTGAAAFVAIDYREDRENPITYIFKGKSLYSAYVKNVSEERPLYLSFEPTGIWFSSMKLPLTIARYGQCNFIKDIPCNYLYRIEHGKVVSKKYYDRTKQAQTVQSTYNTGHYSGYGHNYSNLPAKKDKEVKINQFGYGVLLKDKMTFNRGFYFFSFIKAHGEYTLTRYGYETTANNSVGYHVWFFDGVLLKSAACYDFLVNLQLFSQLENTADFCAVYGHIITYCAYEGYYDSEDEIVWEIDEKFEAYPYCGDISAFFDTTYKVYTAVNGLITKKKEENTACYSADLWDLEHTQKERFDFTPILDFLESSWGFTPKDCMALLNTNDLKNKATC